MMNAELEQQISSVQDRLRALPARSVAAFSAACAERLVWVYEQFTVENHWDCYPTMRRMLDLCWEVLMGRESPRDELRACLAQLLCYVPHGDDFDGVLCTGAQDFAACLESAIKWILLAPDARYGAVCYAFEALHAAAAIAKELAAQANDLAMLEKHPRITELEVATIRNAAVENRHGRI